MNTRIWYKWIAFVNSIIILFWLSVLLLKHLDLWAQHMHTLLHIPQRIEKVITKINNFNSLIANPEEIKLI